MSRLIFNVGAVFDTALVRSGWVAYSNGVIWSGTAPYWIVAMWLSFATTLNVSLRWLRDRIWVALLFGAVGGPLAYLAGASLGALELVSYSAALTALAVGWALMTPSLIWLAQRLDGTRISAARLHQHAC